MPSLLFTVALLFSGLMAGLFFAFSAAVMPGLSRMPDKGFVAAMNTINTSIRNPVFFLIFIGILLLLPASSYLAYKHFPVSSFRMVLAATVIYFLGVFVVTAAVNIPLNNALATVDAERDPAERISIARAAFENRWNLFNGIRMFSAILSFVLLLLGIK